MLKVVGGEVIEAVAALEPVWDELYPPEQDRTDCWRTLTAFGCCGGRGIELSAPAQGLPVSEPPAPRVKVVLQGGSRS